jgi:anti-sigma factor RsiW
MSRAATALPGGMAEAELLGRFLDGPSDPAVERELARRIAADPALGRRLRRHLQIAELAHQRLAVERGGERFAAGWQVRVAAEADAAVFTARTVLRIAADTADRRSELVVIALRAGGLAAAAVLLIGLGWGASTLIEGGRRWLSRASTVSLDGSAFAQSRAVLESLR